MTTGILIVDGDGATVIDDLLIDKEGTTMADLFQTLSNFPLFF